MKSQFSPISPDPQAPFRPLLLSFQSLANGPPLAAGVAEGHVTYRLETDDAIMFSDLKKEYHPSSLVL